MWYVYILLCEDGSFYTGSTNNVEQRFLVHQSGKGGKYTRSHKPVKVLYREECASRSAALKRELEIKSWTKKQKVAFVESSI